MKIFLKILSITVMMLLGTSYMHAQDVELTIKFDEEECMYGVYARPDFTNADFFVAGGSQITVVLPESITNTGLNITNEAGGPWSDNSQIYAPAAAPGFDFHAISSNGSELDFTAGEEILLFTFTLPETCCAPGVRLFNNGSDPDSSAPGMGGGDFNNYFADAFFFIDYYETNYNNAITIDPPTGSATQDFCAIDNPTVSDIVTVEPGVTWYNADTGGSIVSGSTALIDGATYYGSLTSGSCASSVRLAVTVNVGDAAAPTGDANQDFCAVDNPTVSDIVTVENSVVWYDAPTGGNIVDGSESLINNEVYYGSQVIGSCSSSVRLAVTVTINDAATPTGAASQSFCAISNPTVNNLTAGGGTVTWYNADTGGNILTGTTPLAEGETYYGSLTSGECTSSVRLAVTVTIDDAATPSGETSQDFCEIDNPTVNDLIVNESPVTWYNAATGGSSVSGSTALNDGETYYASITNADSGCASSVRLAVTVNINDTSPPTGDAVQDFCAIDSPTVNDIITNESSVTWYNAAAGGSMVSGSTALIDGATYYGSLTGGSCESATRLAVTVNINDTAAPTTTDDTQEFCSYANPTLFDVEVNENNITWYADASGGSALPLGTTLVNNTTYYASATDIVTGCESTSRLPVTVTLTDVCDVTLNVKVMLQGPLLGTVDNLMRDNLRASGLIPLEQPYSDSVNARYTQVDNAGSEVTTNTVLNANSGTADAVVDWIFIELRDALDETTVIKTLSALVQRDGDVIAANGGSLVVSDLPQSFYISVKHRNHFGALAANPVTVSAGAATLDFTTLTGSDLYSLPGYDPDASMITVSGTMALYAGNANYDVRIKYDGVGNDRQTMGSQVLNDPANSGNVLNFANTTGYYSGDVNMDGRVLYDGSNNDRAILQNIVINYPENTSDLNNFNNMIEQIPQ